MDEATDPDEIARHVLQAIAVAGAKGLGKRTVLDAVGVNDSQWSRAIGELLAMECVERLGKGKASRYVARVSDVDVHGLQLALTVLHGVTASGADGLGGDELLLVKPLEERDDWQLLVRIADVGAKEQPILELLQELEPKLGIASDRVAPAAG